jgi:HAD superfamily hydrolase (TIGR01662 family)
MSEVAIIVGYPASGKSSFAKLYIEKGYTYLNRDTVGGKILDLIPLLNTALAGGENVVLDNTFPTIASRKDFIDVAHMHSAIVTCEWLTTSIEDAQFNACMRMIERHGKILSAAEMKEVKSPNIFPPVVLFKYKKEFEKPTTDEGFDVIVKRGFFRQFPKDWVNKAVLLDYDGTLRDTKSGAKWPSDPNDVIALPNRQVILDSWKEQGYMLLGASNQSGIAKGTPTESEAIACFDRTNELIGHDIEVAYCPHKVPPISCFCRKPMPGMAVTFFHKYKLDPSQCIMVGDRTSDKTFAKRSHIGKYVDAEEFFKATVTV